MDQSSDLIRCALEEHSPTYSLLAVVKTLLSLLGLGGGGQRAENLSFSLTVVSVYIKAKSGAGVAMFFSLRFRCLV